MKPELDQDFWRYSFVGKQSDFAKFWYTTEYKDHKQLPTIPTQARHGGNSISNSQVDVILDDKICQFWVFVCSSDFQANPVED